MSGKPAVDFISWAESNEKNHGTVDFSKQYASMKRILEKVKFCILGR